MQTNSIRVIKQDDQQRIWLGTDRGLVILNDSESGLRDIKGKIGDQQVWALAFYKHYVLIGTRFRGLFIYNISNNQLVQHYDSASIGMCRRLKVLRDTVFLATKASAFYLTLREDKWNLTKIKSPIIGGFFTDFALWRDQIFASLYSNGNKNVYQFQNDSLVRSNLVNLKDFPLDMLVTLSLVSNDSLLVVGGDGFNIILDRFNKPRFEKLIKKEPVKPYPVWDAEVVGSKVYMATGNPDNNQDGMIYEPGVTTLDDLQSNFYGQSLYYDQRTMGMWIGTFNRGLYYWPGIAESFHIPNGSTSEFRFKPVNHKVGLLFNKDKVYKTDLVQQEFVEIWDRTKKKINRPILDAIYWNDTTAVLVNNSLVLIDGKTQAVKTFNCTQGNYIFKKDLVLYVFSIYIDVVQVINLKTGSSDLRPSTSNQISASPYNGNLFYSSTYTGFHYFDTISHSFDIFLPTVESYTLHSDTLWVLNAGILKSFKINIQDYKLIPLSSNNIKDRVLGFSPTWVLGNSGRIYCGDNKGFFAIDTRTGSPYSYIYSGNFSEGKPPVSEGEFLYFNHRNYISRLAPGRVGANVISPLPTIRIQANRTIYQYTPFVIYFESDDYLIQKHSLKEIELVKSGKLIRTLFTIEDHYDFPSGMEKGEYIMRVKVNGRLIGSRKISINVPLTSNPLFYVCIIIFIIGFFAVLFKSIWDKRNYDKRTLENRLQLLKQNLNPHFIFNALNLIYSLVLQRKNDAATKTITNFSDLHRYYLDNINKTTVTLEEELKFIENYLKLESERVELDTPFIYLLPNNLDDHMRSVQVPPMILQPLVENAVKYCGNDAPDSLGGHIWIDLSWSGTNLIIGIENTMAKGEITIHGSGTGLRLVNERIEIFNKTFKEDISLQTTDVLKHCKEGYRYELIVVIRARKG